MRSTTTLAALTATCLLGILPMAHDAAAHGGTYPGPGDTVPPGAGGRAGAPGVPGRAAPNAGAPSSGSPTAPGLPGRGPGGSGPLTGAADATGASSAWQYWWNLNREPYLRLKSHLYGPGALTGSVEYYLGAGQDDEVVDLLRPSEQTIREKVVPALLQALARERSNDIVSGCLIALARIGDARGEDGEPRARLAERFAGRLGDPSQEIQETAALALGILGDGAALEPLVATLTADLATLRAHGLTISTPHGERTRAFAAYGLGLLALRTDEITRRAVARALIDELERDPSPARPDVAMACVSALGLCPLPFAAGASPTAEHPDPLPVETRRDQVTYLMALLQDEARPRLVRAHAPTAIARLIADLPDAGDLRQESLWAFGAQLDEHSTAARELQQSCVLALGQLADADADLEDVQARATLVRVATGNADQQARRFALMSLARASARAGSGEGEPYHALADPKTSSRAFLMGQLSRGKKDTREWASLALAVLERGLDDARGPGSSDARAALHAALAGARSPQEVGAHAIACGLVRDPRGAEVLRAKLATTTSPEARGNVCIGLGLAGERGAIETIQEIVHRSKYQPDLLKSAAIALGLLGDRQVSMELIGMLEKASGLSSQASISGALGFIGDARSIDPLIELLQDAQKTDLARGFSAAALGMIADKDEMPWGASLSVDVNYRAATPTLMDPAGASGILNIL